MDPEGTLDRDRSPRFRRAKAALRRGGRCPGACYRTLRRNGHKPWSRGCSSRRGAPSSRGRLFHSQVADLHHARPHVSVATPEEQTEAVRPDLRGAAHEDDVLPLAGVLAALAAVAERLVLKGRDEELAGPPLDDLRRLVLVEDNIAGGVIPVRYPPCSEVSHRLRLKAGTSGCTETATYLVWPRRRNGASRRSLAGPCESRPPA